MDLRKSLVRSFATEADVQLAVLFGSAARGTASRHSDVDVGVLGPASAERLAGLTTALSRATGREVDVVDLRTAPPLLRFEIARDGLVLVERQPHTWVDFRTRAMIDWWDWAPLARRFAAAAARSLRTATSHGQT